MTKPNELFTENMDLASVVARMAQRKFPRLSPKDLHAFALEGLFDAARKYDPDRGIAFKTYAQRRIHGTIVDSVRNLQFLPWRAKQHGAECIRPDDITAIPDEANIAADEELIQTEDAARVVQAIWALPTLERSVMDGHYGRGVRFDHLAAELGISKTWASRVKAKAIAQLREGLQEAV